MSSPRTCRSVPANRCGRFTGPSYGGLPAARHAHDATTGQSAHRGVRAVQTSAPSSIEATPKRAARAGSAGSSAATAARSRAVDGGPASPWPSTARATTRRTFVSTTGCRRP